MASEAVVQDHGGEEQVEKKVNEELETVEQEGVSPSKESGVNDMEDKLKTEESASFKAPLTESKEKVEDKQIEPPAVMEVEKVDDIPCSDVPVAEEKLKAEEPSSSEAPLTESDEKLGDKQIELPAVMEVKKIDDAPGSDVPVAEEKLKAEEPSSLEAPLTESEEKLGDKHIDLPTVMEVKKVDDAPGSDVPVEEEKHKAEESVGCDSHLTESEEKVDDKTIEPPVVMEVEKVRTTPASDVPVAEGSQVETSLDSKLDVASVPEPAVEAVEKEPVESSVSELSTEAVEKPAECLKESPLKESESEVRTEPEEDFVTETKIEKPEPVVDVEGIPQEQSEVIKEVEKKYEILEPKESMDSDNAKDEGTVADNIKEGTESLKEEQITKVQEPVAFECSDTVVSKVQEAEAGPKEGGGSVVPDVVENVSVEDTKTGGVDVVEVLSKEGAVEVGEIEEKNVKIEDNEEKNVKIDELAPPKMTETKDVGDTSSATEVTEKSSEGEIASSDVVVTEEKKEEVVKEGKLDVVDTNVADEPVAESKESGLEVKMEETIQPSVNKLEKMEEMVEEIVKSDASNSELSKNENNSKTDGGPTKQEVPAKSTQKHSNNIISKVKQSLVKVKKAIIGKSPSSKTLSSEARGDVQTK